MSGRVYRKPKFKRPGIYYQESDTIIRRPPIEYRITILSKEKQLEVYDFLSKVEEQDFEDALMLSIKSDLCGETSCRRKEIKELLETNLKKELRSKKLSKL